MLRSILVLLAIGCTTSPPKAADKPAADDIADDVLADVAAVDNAPAMPGLVSEAAFKAAHTLKSEAAPPPRGVAVTLPSGAAAYLSLPPNGERPMPGVVVIHEWWGLNDHIRHWADRLADDGYAALAVDLYGGKVATTSDEAMALMKQVDNEAALTALREAHGFLIADDRVRAPTVGSLGWCFGGGWSLRLALEEAELDAAVVYYGRLETDPAALASLRAPVLGHFGANDKGIPKEAVQTFHDAAKEQGKAVTVHMYDADHAFANPSGARYDEADAAKAWELTRNFLASHLKK